jgi:anti-sigma B factor antagonist
MKMEARQMDGKIVLEVLESRLGAEKAAAFKEAVAPYLEGHPVSIVLDLSLVEFIDSTGLGAILSILKHTPKGCELVICGATESVAGMFRLTRLDRIFTMVKTVNEAVTRLSA